MGREPSGQYSRHHAAINQDASLELDQLRMLAVALGILADLGIAPAMDRDVERSAGLESRDETSHYGQPEGATIVRELIIGNNIAADFEFLQGNTGISTGWEKQHIPIVVAHSGASWCGNQECR